MCGICGKISFDPRQRVEPRLIQKMCDVLQHRGPDEQGQYVAGHVGLGHRRLSIIDLSTGQQPMCNARRDLWIVYNGEVYNFPELRRDLEQKGYHFQTHSDTEVIIHLYDEYGTACVNHLRGMFAFALWDARHKRIFIARDRVGQKPLFYRLTDSALSFASEIKSLLQDESFERRVNLEALSQFLSYQYVPQPNTIFQGIQKLPPAHFLICEGGRVHVDRYWELRYTPKVSMNEQETEERIENVLQEAVRIRMISDVPLGAFLSGGIDSSLVVALMAKNSSLPIQTFSIGFQEKHFNELPYARLIAQRYQTKHHEFIVEPNAVEILPKLVRQFDEPFGDSSALPAYYLAEVTSDNVKVALNGDGGDESFAGYERYLGYRALHWYQQLPRALRKRVLHHLFYTCRQTAQRYDLPAILQTLFRRASLLNDLSLKSEEQLYASRMTIFHEELKVEILHDEIRRELGERYPFDQTLYNFRGGHTDNLVDSMLFSDVTTYLPGDLLVKIDRMTMAHSLEGRSPFLDHHLMELAATLPPHMKLRGRELKSLLKKIGRKWLPPEILSRPKQGFSVPLTQWFRRELQDMLQDLLSSSRLAGDGILRQQVIQRLLYEHQSGLYDHRHRIWILLNLELWYRHFMSHG